MNSPLFTPKISNTEFKSINAAAGLSNPRTTCRPLTFFDIVKAFIFTAVHPRNHAKITQKEYLTPLPFSTWQIYKRRTPRKCGIICCPQDVKLDFIFGLPPVLSLTCLRCRYLVTVMGRLWTWYDQDDANDDNNKDAYLRLTYFKVN